MPHFDLKELLISVGYLGVFLIVFAESGLFFGFFLPGDSLLFTAGILASPAAEKVIGHKVFDLSLLVLLVVVAAIAGDQVGYVFGRRVGPRLFNREDSLFFHKKHIVRAQHFYDKHGGKTIILARFMPVVRTFAPIVAGVGHMNYGRFVFFNVIGGMLWGAGVTVAGYFLGEWIPDIDKYLLPIIALIIIVSVAPPAWHLYQDNKQEINAFVRARLGQRGATAPKSQTDAE